MSATAGPGRFPRALERVGLGLLVGGIAAVWLIGNLAFNLPEVLDRRTAGHFMARVFDHFRYLEAGAALVLVLGIALARERAHRFALRFVGAFLLAALLGGEFFIASRMKELRPSPPASIEDLPKEDSRRRDFGRLHGAYFGCSAGILLLSLGLLATGPEPRPRPS